MMKHTTFNPANVALMMKHNSFQSCKCSTYEAYSFQSWMLVQFAYIRAFNVQHASVYYSCQNCPVSYHERRVYLPPSLSTLKSIKIPDVLYILDPFCSILQFIQLTTFSCCFSGNHVPNVIEISKFSQHVDNFKKIGAMTLNLVLDTFVLSYFHQNHYGI